MIRALLTDLLLIGVFVLIAGMLFGGCALHTPMSQTLMFHDDGSTQPSHRTSHGIGVVGTGTLSSTHFLRQEANRRFSVDEAIDNEIEPANVDNRSYALYGSFYSDHGFALSATLGTAIGVDATWKLWRRNYLTVEGSPGGAQAFLSHRALNRSHLGVAVGTGYRYERKFFDVENRFEGDAPSQVPTYEVLPVHSAGGRLSVVLRPKLAAPGVIRGILYAGYAPVFQRPVITFGITTGVF
ncbi:MAG: hypothetical protein BRD41_02310 [Bacteroidetes bacterium QS_1_63_11]|nr:MAG: hypothetical protein BRD41_02310 [Bacteroidetes bacterium QS_1_63_11]